MTLAELQQQLEARAKLLNDAGLKERLAIVASNEVSASVKRRVFRDGIAQDGSQIGSYSTTPARFSISTPGLPKLSPKSKPPSTRAKKTYYSESGYKGFRNAVGRQNQKVDLNLSGATFQGVGTGVAPSGVPAFGIRTKEALQRIEGNEERFNCITITPNELERKAGIEAALRELKFILNID